MGKQRVTTKIYSESLEWLKIIAAFRRESQPDTLDRLIAEEYRKVGEEIAREATKRVQGRAGSEQETGDAVP